MSAQHALAPDAAPLRFAAQVKRQPLAGQGWNFLSEYDQRTKEAES